MESNAGQDLVDDVHSMPSPMADHLSGCPSLVQILEFLNPRNIDVCQTLSRRINQVISNNTSQIPKRRAQIALYIEYDHLMVTVERQLNDDPREYETFDPDMRIYSNLLKIGENFHPFLKSDISNFFNGSIDANWLVFPIDDFSHGLQIVFESILPRIQLESLSAHCNSISVSKSLLDTLTSCLSRLHRGNCQEFWYDIEYGSEFQPELFDIRRLLGKDCNADIRVDTYDVVEQHFYGLPFGTIHIHINVENNLWNMEHLVQLLQAWKLGERNIKNLSLSSDSAQDSYLLWEGLCTRLRVISTEPTNVYEGWDGYFNLQRSDGKHMHVAYNTDRHTIDVEEFEFKEDYLSQCPVLANVLSFLSPKSVEICAQLNKKFNSVIVDNWSKMPKRIINLCISYDESDKITIQTERWSDSKDDYVWHRDYPTIEIYTDRIEVISVSDFLIEALKNKLLEFWIKDESYEYCFSTNGLSDGLLMCLDVLLPRVHVTSLEISCTHDDLPSNVASALLQSMQKHIDSWNVYNCLEIQYKLNQAKYQPELVELARLFGSSCSISMNSSETIAPYLLQLPLDLFVIKLTTARKAWTSEQLLMILKKWSVDSFNIKSLKLCGIEKHSLETVWNEVRKKLGAEAKLSPLSWDLSTPKNFTLKRARSDDQLIVSYSKGTGSITMAAILKQ